MAGVPLHISLRPKTHIRSTIIPVRHKRAKAIALPLLPWCFREQKGGESAFGTLQ